MQSHSNAKQSKAKQSKTKAILDYFLHLIENFSLSTILIIQKITFHINITSGQKVINSHNTSDTSTTM